MSSRLAILAGLISGILVAALVLGGIFAFAPEERAVGPSATPAATPAPSDVPPSATPSATPTPSDVPPSATPSVSAPVSLAPSGSSVPSADGLQTILPGVTVTP